jgi:hypothetical protein
MSIFVWSYDLCLRTKNSSGTPLHYFFAYGAPGEMPPIQPVRCGPISPGEKKQLERPGLDYSEDPLLVGVRYRLPVAWEERKEYVRGSASRVLGGGGVNVTSLGALLSDLFTVGNYLEVSVNGGSSFRICYVDSEVNFVSVTGKNVSVGLEVTFAQKAIRQVVGGVASADW